MRRNIWQIPLQNSKGIHLVHSQYFLTRSYKNTISECYLVNKFTHVSAEDWAYKPSKTYYTLRYSICDAINWIWRNLDETFSFNRDNLINLTHGNSIK